MKPYVLHKGHPDRELVRANLHAFIDRLPDTKSWRIEIRETARTRDQNDKFHAVCHELSRSRKWAGRFRDTEGWKRLLVDAWGRAEGRTQGEVVPSLDGQSVVTLGIQTRRMPVADMVSLIEFAEAYASDAEAVA